MPIITYIIQKQICKEKRGKKYWYILKENIEVEVSDEVAEFLKHDDGREKRYQDKIRKQIKKANIVKVFSLDEELSE